jgi:hypothetical protein
MDNPFQLVWWALAIGIAWMILISCTGLDEWLKKLAGKKGSDKKLAEGLKALEDRVKELEKNRKAKRLEGGQPDQSL